MNTLKNKLVLPVIASTLLLFNSVSANAHNNECHLSLKNDLSVTPDHIRIIEDDETMVDIYKDRILFIKGEQIQLTDKQQSMINEYSTSIRKAIPEVTEIAIEAVGLAFEGLNAGLGKFVDMEVHEDKFKIIQEKIREKYNSNEGRYSITEGEFNMDIDDGEVDELVNEIVDDMVPTIIGGLISNMGQAIASGDDIDFDNFGENIEREIEAKADLIEVKADAFCNSMKRVDKLEQALVATNPKFVYLDLLEIEH